MPTNKTLLFLFIILFLGLSLFSSLGHNHKFDGKHHPNCLACTVTASFLPLVVSKLNLIISFLFIGYVFFFLRTQHFQVFSLCKDSRAPPTNS
jgi:hypothetical protein